MDVPHSLPRNLTTQCIRHDRLGPISAKTKWFWLGKAQNIFPHAPIHNRDTSITVSKPSTGKPDWRMLDWNEAVWHQWQQSVVKQGRKPSPPYCGEINALSLGHWWLVMIEKQNLQILFVTLLFQICLSGFSGLCNSIAFCHMARVSLLLWVLVSAQWVAVWGKKYSLILRLELYFWSPSYRCGNTGLAKMKTSAWCCCL